MKRAFTLVMSLSLILSCYGQRMETGIIYGDNHSYSLTAPKGWLLDNKSGVSSGLHAVFYPKGGSWENSGAVMYTNVAQLNATDQTNAQDVIDYDIGQFKKSSPDIKIEKADTIKTSKQGRNAIVYTFLKDSNGNCESVAYIEEDKVVVLVTMSSRTEKDYLESEAAFKELVESYYWLTNKVESH